MSFSVSHLNCYADVCVILKREKKLWCPDTKKEVGRNRVDTKTGNISPNRIPNRTGQIVVCWRSSGCYENFIYPRVNRKGEHLSFSLNLTIHKWFVTLICKMKIVVCLTGSVKAAFKGAIGVSSDKYKVILPRVNLVRRNSWFRTH